MLFLYRILVFVKIAIVLGCLSALVWQTVVKRHFKNGGNKRISEGSLLTA